MCQQNLKERSDVPAHLQLHGPLGPVGNGVAHSVRAILPKKQLASPHKPDTHFGNAGYDACNVEELLLLQKRVSNSRTHELTIDHPVSWPHCRRLHAGAHVRLHGRRSLTSDCRLQLFIGIFIWRPERAPPSPHRFPNSSIACIAQPCHSKFQSQ